VKKETIGEITAAAQVMREFSTKVHVADATVWQVDIVGWAAAAHTFNVSNGARCFVAALPLEPANMAVTDVSSKSGSADVMEAASASTCAGTVAALLH
jgi:anthranilate phosphoribosyltransferase